MSNIYIHVYCYGKNMYRRTGVQNWICPRNLHRDLPTGTSWIRNSRDGRNGHSKPRGILWSLSNGSYFYFILLKMELILWLQHCQKKIYNIINIFVKCLKSTVQQLSNHLLKYIKNYNFKFLSGPNSFTLHCELNNL